MKKQAQVEKRERHRQCGGDDEEEYDVSDMCLLLIFSPIPSRVDAA